MKNATMMTAALMLGALVFSGCSSKPKIQGTAESDDPMGKLMAKKSELMKNGVIAEVATAESQDLQTAINKVELETRGQMTRAMESKNASLQKRFTEEVGDEFLEHFTQVTKNVSSRVLTGTTLLEAPYHETKDGKYRAFGLMVLDPKAFADAMAAEMAADEAMKTRWLASKAYKELEQEAANFEKFKAEQKTGMMGGQQE